MRSILPFEKNPALRTVSREIPRGDIVSSKIRALIKDMKELLSKEAYGVALAAAQVGEPVRLFIVSGKALARGKRRAPEEAQVGEKTPTPEKSALPDEVYINPKLIRLSRGTTLKHEGCLSIRGKWGEVPRAEKTTLRYFDERGESRERGASGFLAHIFQHEMDHLDGILYIDKVASLYDDADTQA